MKKIVLKLIAKVYEFFKQVYFVVKYDSYRKKYDIAEDFRFNGENILFYGEGKIIIDENSYIGWNSTIQSSSACVVKVGKNCSISHNVRIYTESNFTKQNFDLLSKKIKTSGDVIIGNGVWIGVNVFIRPGVKIGDNAVIGANSVVTRDIESNSVVGGVPARFIKKIALDD